MRTKTIILLAACFYQLSISAQSTSFFVDSLIIQPVNPNDNDSIVFFAYVRHPTFHDPFFDKKVIISDTLINIYTCYVSSGLFANEYRVDTTSIGKLSIDNYRIRYILKFLLPHEVDSFEACLTNPYYDSTFINFSVSAAAPINEIKTTAFSASVYPNPASNTFHLSVKSETEEDFTIRMFNSLGQLAGILYQGQAKEVSQDINTGKLTNGVYSVQIESSSNHKLLKLVIQK